MYRKRFVQVRRLDPTYSCVFDKKDLRACYWNVSGPIAISRAHKAPAAAAKHCRGWGWREEWLGGVDGPM